MVICTHAQERWHSLLDAVDSVRHQTHPALEVIVVIDHSDQLLERAASELRGTVVKENRYERGLSGARNTGVQAARGGIVAFLDDDAVAEAKWLEHLGSPYKDPRVMAVGGAVLPMWTGRKPRWHPDEFAWVVGCSYAGMPETTAPVRNVLGCNMSFRSEVFATIGGFQPSLGRIASTPAGCEETELCIRVHRHWMDGVIVYEPAARVYHRVPPARGSRRYFRDRCFAEGLSKAVVSRLAGPQSGLATERSYVLRTLPRGMVRGMGASLLRQDPSGVARAAAILSGLAVTTAGYIKGTLWSR